RTYSNAAALGRGVRVRARRQRATCDARAGGDPGAPSPRPLRGKRGTAASLGAGGGGKRRRSAVQAGFERLFFRNELVDRLFDGSIEIHFARSDLAQRGYGRAVLARHQGGGALH